MTAFSRRSTDHRHPGKRLVGNRGLVTDLVIGRGCGQVHAMRVANHVDRAPQCARRAVTNNTRNQLGMRSLLFAMSVNVVGPKPPKTSGDPVAVAHKKRSCGHGMIDELFHVENRLAGREEFLVRMGHSGCCGALLRREGLTDAEPCERKANGCHGRAKPVSGFAFGLAVRSVCLPGGCPARVCLASIDRCGGCCGHNSLN